ncbi:MAG: outer membrane lipoprotein chaperone LolA [Myxococcales bacterium]|nr:outer membrane lipoprotein chaperone LolA [Myxococcales bacterium]
MKPTKSLQLLITLVGLAVAASLAPVAHAEPSLDDAVRGIEAFYGKVEYFKANFQQEVRRAHLSRPLKKSGKVYYIKPGKMRWDYTQPDKVYYVSDGDTLWSYEVATKQAIKMDVRRSELYDSLKFLFGEGDLRQSFTITLGPSEDGLQALLLTPKGGQQNYKTLTLWAKPGTWEIARSELVDPLDNVSVITFTGATYEALDPAAFAFKPPKGASIQDLTPKPGEAPGEPPAEPGAGAQPSP